MQCQAVRKKLPLPEPLGEGPRPKSAAQDDRIASEEFVARDEIFKVPLMGCSPAGGPRRPDVCILHELQLLICNMCLTVEGLHCCIASMKLLVLCSERC